MKIKLYIILICILACAVLTSCSSANAADKKENGLSSVEYTETETSTVTEESESDAEVENEAKVDYLVDLLPEHDRKLFESSEPVSLWFSFARGNSNEGLYVDDPAKVTEVMNILMKAEVSSMEEFPSVAGSCNSVKITFAESEEAFVFFEITENALELRNDGIRYIFAEHPLGDYLNMLG